MHHIVIISKFCIKALLYYYCVLVLQVLAPGSVSTPAVLDDKILFMKEARALGLPVPEFHEITSCHDVVQLASTGRVIISSSSGSC